MGYEGTAYFTNPSFDDAILGVSDDGKLIYDYDLMLDYMVNKEDCSYEDAIDWVEYNTIRTIPYMGGKAPIIMYRL